ncbi:MAG: transketolase [Nitratireductor sp.]|nr:transketolase [Nitratireductor sp.]
MTQVDRHAEMANAIRFLSVDAVEHANSGHPGLPMGAADIVTVLFTNFMDFNPKHPDWPDRDRFVLSAGHGSMLLYSLLYLLGYEDIDLDEIKNFRQLGSKTAGHPEYGHAAGVETTTGPLGQGLANAVGMAIAERKLNAEFGDDVVDHRTFCLVGDGCLMEGISQEAISLAGHLRLSKLTVLWDDNDISIDGAVSLSDSTDQLARFRASGWNTLSVDGHKPAEIADALEKADKSDRPTLIACRTTIGFGAPTKAGTSKVHGSPLGAEEIKGMREKLGWKCEPFKVPAETLDLWRIAGLRSAQKYKEWEKRFAALDPEIRGEFERRMRGDMPAALNEALEAMKRTLGDEKPTMATRKSSEAVLEVINGVVAETIGGSADLTGSNNTKAKSQKPVSKGDFGGSYVHYGVREHGMAAAMNGMALHGGVVPYGGTFMVFTDYCRPAIRLSALMRQRVVYVMTHDSIGLGEDGPTHQPVEHLAALRAIPNLNVFRPADGVETAECWALALAASKTPSVLALTRQNVPNLRTRLTDENPCAKGGYVLREAPAKRDVTLIASGSEVGLAATAADMLAKEGIAAAIVSMPSFELFRAQPEAYRFATLGDAPRIAIEAGIAQGWHEWIRHKDRFVGLSDFGASAPAAKLFEHFGLTPARVVAEAKALVKG